MIKKISPRLNDVLQALLFHNMKEFQFYFYFLNYVDFYEDPALVPKSMGVTVKDMRLALLYHPEFLEEHTDIEIMATLIHEVKHLLHNHHERGKYYEPQTSNIAMDMIINHLIMTYHKSVHLSIHTQERHDKMIAEAVASGQQIDPAKVKMFEKMIGKTNNITLDPNYKGDLVFEPLYKWLKEEYSKHKEGKPNELSEMTKHLMDSTPDGQTSDAHIPMDEIMEEVKKQLGQQAMEKTKVQLRGMGSSDVEESMKMLLKPPASNNLRLLKRVIAAFKGAMKVESFRRLNRRVPGIKGNKKVSQSINVGLDVSGSMYGRFEVVLSELFRDGFEIDLVQVDTKIQKIDKITRKEQLKTMMIQGLGGTELQPFINYVLNPKNKLLKSPTVILTDGECDSFDFKGSAHQFLIISCGREVNYRNGSNVKQVVIKN